MPNIYGPSEDMWTDPEKVFTAPALTDGEVLTVPGDDQYYVMVFALDGSWVGQTIYVVPDVGILSWSKQFDSPDSSTLFDEVEVQWAAVYTKAQYTSASKPQTNSPEYLWGPLDDAYSETDATLDYRYQTYLGHDSKGVTLTIPDLPDDVMYSTPGDVTSYEGLFLAVAVKNGANLPYRTGYEDGHFLITTNPDTLAAREDAWGAQWINHFYMDGSAPESPDPFAEQMQDYISILKKLLKVAGAVPKVQAARDVANQYLDLAHQIKMDGIALGSPSFGPFVGPDPDFDEFRMSQVGSDASKFEKAMKWGGKLLNVADAAMEGIKTYQETGGDYSKTVQAAGVRLVAAMVGGEVGSIVGAGAATMIVGVVGAPIAATGVATVAGLAVGYFAGKYLAQGIEMGANWAIDSVKGEAPPQLKLEAAGTASPKPTWSYNVDTGVFKWLDAKAEAKYGQYLTLLDINPKPVGLKLVGDLYDDKDDFLLGHGGSDTMSSGAGNDLLYGAAGNDSMSGGKKNDILYGHAGKDTIMGGDGGDFIFGGKGGDRILAGKGADALTGEAGKDRFVFTTVKEIGKGSAGDTIYDFRRGPDKIDLSAIDANTHKSGNQTFKWSQLTKTVVQDDWKPYLLVEGDTNKDGIPDFSLKLVGLAAVSAADFIL